MTRWYEVWVFHDILGDITVVRKWGGKASRRENGMTEVAASPEEAMRRFDVLDEQRRKRFYQKTWEDVFIEIKSGAEK